MFISPMLLHKSNQPFDNDEWLTQLKLDGIRCILSKINGTINLYSRHKNNINSKFPELQSIEIPDNIILDGELIVYTNDGKPDFEAVMEKFMSSKSEYQVTFCVFDVIQYNNIRITHLPLIERLELLSDIVSEDNTLITKVPFVEGNAIAYFDLIKQQDLEGIVIKRKDSKYQINKRSSDWLKVINYKYTDVFIAGLRKEKFGLLLQYENGEYAGLLEFMQPVARREFYSKYRSLITGENNRFVFVTPQFRIKVKFRNYTKRGLLRIPSFVKWAN